MHIPDGYLSPAVSLAMNGVAATAVGVAVKKVSRKVDEQPVPLMGVTAAFIFAAQMINFPIGGGTSGHLVGAVLVASLLGTGPGILVMTTVFIVQALFFSDGGLLALGANLINMGIVGCVLGGIGAAWDRKRSCEKASFVGRFLAAWLAVLSGAALTSLELAASGTVPLRLVLPPMLGVHTILGVGEAVLTVAVLSFLQSPVGEGRWVRGAQSATRDA